MTLCALAVARMIASAMPSFFSALRRAALRALSSSTGWTCALSSMSPVKNSNGFLLYLRNTGGLLYAFECAISMDNVRIVGTSHISEQAARSVRKAYEEFQPDIVAVELDRRRLQALQTYVPGQKTSLPPGTLRKVGLTGFLFMLIGGWLQKKLAGIVKVQPGLDMLEAVQLAQKDGKEIALVDRDVLLTMQRLSRAFGAREKMRMFLDIFRAPFMRKYRFRIDEVPPKELILELMGLMQERYPGLYRVLVEERNMVMAGNVERLCEKHPEKRILLVVGAGHEDGIRKLLANPES